MELVKELSRTTSTLMAGRAVQNVGMPTIIPIPGATDPERVEENATEVKLTERRWNGQLDPGEMRSGGG